MSLFPQNTQILFPLTPVPVLSTKEIIHVLHLVYMERVCLCNTNGVMQNGLFHLICSLSSVY